MARVRYVKFIATYALTFFGYITSVLASVHAHASEVTDQSVKDQSVQNLLLQFYIWDFVREKILIF